MPEKVIPMRALLLSAILVLATANASAAPSVENVALHGVVSLEGSGFKNNGNRALPSSITDGVFVADTQAWNNSTVYWLGGKPSDTLDSVMVTMGAPSLISSIRLQADTLDTYTIDYRNGTQAWQSLSTLSTRNSLIGYTYTHGMGIAEYTLLAPVTASAFRIRGNGDGLYAVSEFQAFGIAAEMPEPASWAILGTGLALIGCLRRRRPA